MKNVLVLLGSVLLLASCSAPKYSYHFDHYDYHSGKKKVDPEKELLAENKAKAEEIFAEESPLRVEKESITASAETGVVTPSRTVTPTAEKKIIERKYSDLTKAEKKEFRHALKTEIKKVIKAKKTGDNINDTKALEYNLKMALIFGVVALTLGLFGGVNTVFWVASVISLVIALVFFIKWIAEQ
jgi:hypothetical protein